MNAILGIKKEMTQIFSEDGKVTPVTIIDVNNVYVAGVKTLDRDGYIAVIIGQGKKKKPTKPELGKYAELGHVPTTVKEIKVDSVDDIKIGTKIDAESFVIDDKVNVTGVTKGKGFQGVVKRWGFAGGPKTHGQSDRERAPGSIGAGTTPGRVYKGKKMPGHMGARVKTVENLKVAKVINEHGLLILKGAVPGSKGSIVMIRK